MSGLTRTKLTISQKVEFAAAAVAEQDQWGNQSRLSERFGVSRRSVATAREQGERALGAHFAEQEAGLVWVAVDAAHVRRCVVALRVMGQNSLRSIEDLLPVLFAGVQRSYGAIQQVLVEAEQQAARFNAGMDLSAVNAVALDEMFSQGEPVLAAVDLDSGLLAALKVSEQRDAKSWAAVLGEAQEQGLQPQVVVKDAAAGIAAGVSAVFPQAEQRDDCFHALYALNKVLRPLERTAYRAIEREHQALLVVSGCQGPERQQAKLAALKAGVECLEAMERFERAEAARDQVHAALECVDLERGELYSAEQVQTLIEQAAAQLESLEHEACGKVGRYLRNRAAGLALAQASLRPKLDALSDTFSAEAVILACIVCQRIQALTTRCLSPAQQRAYRLHLRGATVMLLQRLGQNQTDAVIEAVQALLVQRHRASSAIEGFNATLRPYLYVHKGVSQGFLELFRAWYNLRTRRWGRHQKTTAFTTLTGQSVEDWLSLLGYPPTRALH